MRHTAGSGEVRSGPIIPDLISDLPPDLVADLGYFFCSAADFIHT